MWYLRHGAPKEVRGDQEFDRASLKKWMSLRGSKFVALPSRRHNKAGIVERKNRVVKDALEKLTLDKAFAKMPIRDKVAIAQFLSNILYSSSFLSSFELVRGYTPAVEGTEKKAIPDDVLKAHKELEARRLLARMLKSMPNRKREMDIQAGDTVLCLLPDGNRPRGHWVEEFVTELPDENSVVVGTGRNREVIAKEDVRKLPKS